MDEIRAILGELVEIRRRTWASAVAVAAKNPDAMCALEIDAYRIEFLNAKLELARHLAGAQADA